LAFTSDRRSAFLDQGIWIVRADGTAARRVTPEVPRITADEPTWSPDGSKLVFVRNESDLYLINRNGTNMRRLTAARTSVP
jgi:Tol biopolymer transport system component